jgi:GT2 family glycosyltransferase
MAAHSAPSVSIITALYNAEPYIEQALESVRIQTFPCWEHVVVDDGSTDASAAVVHRWAAADPRIRLVQQPNRGAANARNRGFAASSGTSRYLLFLDADDVLEPTMLEALVRRLDDCRGVGMAYCDVHYIDASARLLSPNAQPLRADRYVPAGWRVHRLPPDVSETPFVSVFSAWAGLLPSNALLRRDLYAQTPGWDETFGQPGEDADLFINLALRAPVRFLPDRLVRYRRHSGQATSVPARVQAQGRKLDRKWRPGCGLPPEQERRLLEAWRFRERQVLPYLWLTWGTAALRRGRLVAGATCYGRALKHFAGSFARVAAPGAPARNGGARSGEDGDACPAA